MIHASPGARWRWAVATEAVRGLTYRRRTESADVTFCEALVCSQVQAVLGAETCAIQAVEGGWSGWQVQTGF